MWRNFFLIPITLWIVSSDFKNACTYTVYKNFKISKRVFFFLLPYVKLHHCEHLTYSWRQTRLCTIKGLFLKMVFCHLLIYHQKITKKSKKNQKESKKKNGKKSEKYLKKKNRKKVKKVRKKIKAQWETPYWGDAGLHHDFAKIFWGFKVAFQCLKINLGKNWINKMSSWTSANREMLFIFFLRWF